MHVLVLGTMYQDVFALMGLGVTEGESGVVSVLMWPLPIHSGLAQRALLSL